MPSVLPAVNVKKSANERLLFKKQKKNGLLTVLFLYSVYFFIANEKSIYPFSSSINRFVISFE